MQILKNFYENHLAKILLRGALRPVPPHNFCHQRIEPLDKFTGCDTVVAACAIDQCASMLIVIHAYRSVSTPMPLTGSKRFRLQKTGQEKIL